MFHKFEMLGLRADTIDLKTTFFFLCDCIVLDWHIVFETFINLSVVLSGLLKIAYWENKF